MDEHPLDADAHLAGVREGADEAALDRPVEVGALVDDSPFGFKLDINDGSGPIQIFLFPGSGISTAGLVAGATIDTVCFSNQFEAIFECDPPNAGDCTVE